MADPPTCLALVSPIPGSPLEYTPYKTAKLSTQKAPDAHGVEARASKAGTCRPPIGQKGTAAFSAAERTVDTHGGFRGGFHAILKGVPWGFRGFRGGSAGVPRSTQVCATCISQAFRRNVCLAVLLKSGGADLF